MNNNDLISRKALKGLISDKSIPIKFEEKRGDWRCSLGMPLRDIYKTIDNAPTVTPSLNLDNITEEDIEKFKIIWQRATSKGLFPTIEDRWQAEWIHESQETSFYKMISFKCSGCGWKVSKKSRYCPNCGKYMLNGGTENENHD